MALYRYVKATKSKKMFRSFAVSFLLMGTGGLLVLWVAWPIISFSLFSEGFLSKTVSPVSDVSTQVKAPQAFSPVAFAADSASTVGVVDYTNPNVWFPTSPQKKVVAPVNSYTLSIPSLRIKNAQVVIGGDDLSKSLIHYGGTSLPGEFGNAVIFGHSTLPQLYNPSNYKTIFSELPSMKPGDTFTIFYDGISYTYTVFDLVVVDPTDLSVLEQKYDDSYVTLVTCVPPGTYWKRLNVHARLKRV
ncbi:sortase [Candidatus Gottesmanbacteria bacterium]|nr:sortase [Candidatus Gottesmanbacteria bacterium]